MNRHSSLTFVLGVVVILLTAMQCGEPPNLPPSADAGADQSAVVNQEVTLDGSASRNPDGDKLSFDWRFSSTPAQSSVNLQEANTATPRFTPDRPGAYTAELIVSDGKLTDADSVTIVASEASANQPPKADAGGDRAVTVGDTVTLNANGSTVPDGDTLSYSWSLTSTPSGSAATLSTPSGEQTDLTPDVSGAYTVTLTVSDGSATDSDEVTITASSAPNPNQPPIADAGSDQTAQEGDTVVLDGASTHDPDGDALSYAWRFVTWPDKNTSPAPALTGADTSTPSFTANEEGDYTLELSVSDGEFTDSDRVTVSATSSTPSGTVYVSPSGNDGNSGRREDPLRTLKKALELAHANEGITAISLADGIYSAGETFDYTLTRTLFIEGESQDGTILDAGDKRIFALESPAGASDPVKLRLQDLTLKTTGTGVYLPSDTEAYLTRITCLHTDPCAQASELLGFIPAPGGTLIVRDSRVTGQGSGQGFTVVGREHLIDGTTISGYDRGINAFAASFQMTGLTLTDNGYGLYLLGTIDTDLDGTEDPVILQSSTLADNGTGIHAEQAQLRLENVTITGSATHGVFLTGSNTNGNAVFTDVIISESGASGVYLGGGALEVNGGRYSQNGQQNPDDFVDRAGLYATGGSTLVVKNAEVSGNLQDNIVILEDAFASLNGVTATGAPGLGAGLYANTSTNVTVTGGSYSDNNNGFYITGSTSLTLKNVTASDNRYSGLSFRANGRLFVRESEFLDNERYNIQIRGASTNLDLGTNLDPGNNTLRMDAETDWSLSDERPDRSDNDGSILEAHGLDFVQGSSTFHYSGVKTGPDNSPPHWRITGDNQRIRF